MCELETNSYVVMQLPVCVCYVTCVIVYSRLCGYNWDVLCQGNTSSFSFFFLQQASQSETIMGVFAWWKPQSRGPVSVLIKGMCMPVSEPYIDAWIKHMINKINSTSPLLVTQHQDQGMWKWKQRGPSGAAEVFRFFFKAEWDAGLCIETVRLLNTK